MNFKCGVVSRNEIYLIRLLNGHAFKDFFRLPRFILYQMMRAEAVAKMVHAAYLLADA